VNASIYHGRSYESRNPLPPHYSSGITVPASTEKSRIVGADGTVYVAKV